MKNKVIKRLNRKSHLPLTMLLIYPIFQLMFKYSKNLSEKCVDYIPNYMTDDYYYKYFFISFSGYPNDESIYRLTNMRLTSNKYHVFNIKVGDVADRAEEILLRNNYHKVIDNSDDMTQYTHTDVCYEADDVQIGFDLENKIIKKVEIYVVSEYLGNNIY